MSRTQPCPLCRSQNSDSFQFAKEEFIYHRCGECDLISVDPSQRLDPAGEKERYHLHENHFDDKAYRNFLKPLYDVIVARHSLGSAGLDFGAGSGPVLAQMLENAGYKMDLYDPYFWPEKAPLQKKFDFIVSSEVFEHLYNPAEEIRMLLGCLKPGATLGIMTSLTDEVHFESWYYRRDPTHVSFYSSRTMLWIKKHYGFTQMQIENKRTIWFQS